MPTSIHRNKFDPEKSESDSLGKIITTRKKCKILNSKYHITYKPIIHDFTGNKKYHAFN